MNRLTFERWLSFFKVGHRNDTCQAWAISQILPKDAMTLKSIDLYLKKSISLKLQMQLNQNCLTDISTNLIYEILILKNTIEADPPILIKSDEFNTL